jgi:hypothetical protein
MIPEDDLSRRRIHLVPKPIRLVLLAVAGCAVGGLCVYGGVRLALQGEWLWGGLVAAAGGWLLLKAVLGYRTARTGAEGSAPPGSPARRRTRDGTAPPRD